jgi:hypothetical protein
MIAFIEVKIFLYEAGNLMHFACFYDEREKHE